MVNLLSRTVRNDTQETRTWTSVTVSRTAPPILLQKSHGVKRLHMNIHIIIYTHTVPQPPGGTAEFTFSYKSSSVPNWNVGFSVSPMAGLFLLCGCVCVCVCIEEEWRLASSRTVHYSLSHYLWCLSDVCMWVCSVCVSVQLYNSWCTAISLLLGIRPVGVWGVGVWGVGVWGVYLCEMCVIACHLD